jgi:DNA-binding NarL/FixJ family response regulator
MTTIRVVIGDDDARFRATVIDVLDADARFEVVGEAGTGAELLEVSMATEPDIVLLDVRMPGGGTEAARALSRIERYVRGQYRPTVVALTAEAAPETIVALLRAGAVGYLVKGRVGATLPDLLERAFSGSVVLAAPSAAQALRQLVTLASSVPQDTYSEISIHSWTEDPLGADCEA